MAASCESLPAIACSSSAASRTLRHIGPGVSCVNEIGTMPSRLSSPTVGLMPTSAWIDDGDVIEPSVSVPTPAAHRLAATALPVPDDEPLGLRSSAYGFSVWPPRALQPLTECTPRMLAHSDRLDLASSTAPASRSRCTTNASRGTWAPINAGEPALVCMRSAVARLSFTTIGTPCSGPRQRPARASSSSRCAIASASGLSSITLFKDGPARSMSAMRVA